MRTIKEKVKEQIDIFSDLQNAGFNIVTCGSCGSINLHLIDHEGHLECAFCDMISDPCDFPDYWTTGDENSSQFDEIKR